MDNYEATAYAVVAVSELNKQGKDINKQTITAKMVYLMDMNSESEILKKADKVK